MAEPDVIRAEQSGVIRLTLNRPQKRNALSRGMLLELRSHVAEAASRRDIRLLVLTASGPAFCAGMDLAEMQATAAEFDAEATFRQDTELYREVVSQLIELACPVLAVVPGPAVAGGMGLHLACDLVLAADSALFWLPEPRRGIVAAIVTPLLKYRCGVSAASWMLLSGEGASAERALQLGLCHRVVPSAELASEEAALVKSILTGAPGALSTSKWQLQECAAGELKAQLEAAARVSARARETPDAREGLAAFLEKRPPAWQPK